jgi:TRAP-type C4-dicarboxylate transport system permease small subunit
MWFRKAVATYSKILGGVSRVLFGVGGAALVGMMVITGADVALRNAIRSSVTGAYDITEYMMAIAVSFGLAYCALKNGHIHLDLIITKLPRRTRLIVNTITSLISMVFAAIICWQTFLSMKNTIGLGLRSNQLPIPVFPFMGAVAFGFALFSLVRFEDLLKILSGEEEKSK